MASDAHGGGEGKRRYAIVAVLALLGLAGAIAIGVAIGSSSGSGGKSGHAKRAAAISDLQKVTFQKPADPGPDPFTAPTDRQGRRTVSLPAGGSSSGAGTPFGGSGSNVVCDRDRLIRFMKANPDRRRAWALVLGISPTYAAVRRYIARLHPVTLTRDTRVTNHTYAAGQAIGVQSILAAGTAVLVDDYGRPVVRCRCGNPLTQPVFLPQATCQGCPPHYSPPPEVCTYWQQHITYRRTWYPGDYYPNTTYDAVFIRRTRHGPFESCWAAYPEPPTVTIVDIFRAPPPAPVPAAAPAPSTPAPRASGRQCNPPRSQYEFEVCRDLGLLDQHMPEQHTPTYDTPPPTHTYDTPTQPVAPPDNSQLPVCDPISPVPPCRPG
jgi:hypothetical protein